MTQQLNSLYQHFRPNEQAFIEQINDICQRVEDTYAFQVTKFLDPRQVLIVKSIVGQNAHLNYFMASTTYPMEYAKIIIAPTYYELDERDFSLTLLELRYNAKFNHITHSQVMGSLIHSLGIERSRFGDIIVGNGFVQIFIDSTMASYVMEQQQKIGRVPVKWREVSLREAASPHSDGQEMEFLVASMRLDTVLAAVLKLSRVSVAKLIATEKVKLNYSVTTKSSEQLEIGDMLSIRGYGRVILKRENGLSKHGKYKITVDRIIHRKSS